MQTLGSDARTLEPRLDLSVGAVSRRVRGVVRGRIWIRYANHRGPLKSLALALLESLVFARFTHSSFFPPCLTSL